MTENSGSKKGKSAKKPIDKLKEDFEKPLKTAGFAPEVYKEQGVSGGKSKSSKEELKEKDKTIEEYVSRIKYLQADFENYKKAVEREKESIVKRASDELILKLLDVYENLERAIENGREEKDSLLEGVEMTYNQLKSLLESEGLVAIKAVGEKLDPFRHEAIMREENRDIEEDIILEEFQRGYMLKDRVIRYSKVKVSKR